MSLPRSVPDQQSIVYLVGKETVELRREPIADPGPGELLLQVNAALVCGTDVKAYRRGGHPTMIEVPSPFGHELTGTVVAQNATAFALGERLVIANSTSCEKCRDCKLGQENLCPHIQYLNGAFAEYLLVPEAFVRGALRVPESLSSEAAALTEPLACVLHCLHELEATLRRLAGEPADVVVFGAGAMGLMLTALLAELGHSSVIVDPNPGRLALGKKAGARESLIVDRLPGQFTRIRALAEDPSGFDVAIDASGSPSAWSDATHSVRPGGQVLFYGGCAPGTQVAIDTEQVHYGELSLKGVYHYRRRDFAEALDLLAAGAIDPSLLITDRVPLVQIDTALRGMMDRQHIKIAIGSVR